MAQRSKNRQPVYSADTLALRYVCGLVLAALGIMMFLAVGVRLPGNVFDVLRQVSFGLAGGLALALPVFPIWGGVLVIWSTQRKAPVRPFVFIALAFWSLCAAVVLVTRIGQREMLQYLAGAYGGEWSRVIAGGYRECARLGASGGALGVALGYPFWSLVGQILGTALLILMILLFIALAFRLTPARIRELKNGMGRRGGNRREIEQQQIAYQQEQERQRQAAYAQQQAYILQQQQQAQWPQQANAGAPEQSGPVTDNSVLDWQMQLGSPDEAETTSRESRIFQTQNAGNQSAGGAWNTPAGGSQIFGQPAGQEKPRGGKLFGLGRKKAEDDGLSALSETEKRREGMAYPVPETGRNRQSVNRETPAKRPAEANAAETENRKSRARVQQEQVEEDLNRWRAPETPETPAPAAETPARPPEAEPREMDSWQRPADERRETAERTGRKPAAEKKPAAQEAEQQEMSPWLRQVEERREAAERTGRKPAAPEIPAEEPAPPAERVAVPVVQETIKDPTWKPELKHVTPREEEPEEDEYWEPTPYYPPLITNLKKPEVSAEDTAQEDAERSRRLEATLASFKVQARVVHVTHGPAISRFELELAPGTKVGKVAELERDIAYGMQATSVRIEAPIPGKSLVGVEVPNPKRATVTLRELLESQPMQNAKSILTVALGRDIAGTPIVCDLAKMPHMLIAGATGSGKSVCINTIINSLLFRASPDEVRMILIDPKVVELQCYNGIPHLLLPVVNDPHKASAALAWAVAEMMDRYDKFSERGVRNLEGYNGSLGPGEKPMPRIVIIIDELADLMMVCKKDVEEYICRLTQLARAAGIHLIVATQRPSVDVITGLIKANIPSRIAFKTASYVDSRTILDRNGSEQLLGLGDMLYLPTGSFAPIRIQGCFLSDQEVNQIADQVRTNNPSTYDPNILDKVEELSRGSDEAPGMDMIGGAPETGPGDADLFAQAVEYAIADGQISTSTLQRRLKVGYARAGRLTDEMEERGIVSAKDGSKPRKCLITREQWEAMKADADAP